MMFRDAKGGPVPAQLSVRTAVLGGLALAMFSIIFFRLWYLQVLSSGTYKAQAENNQVRDITVQAPRGRILDRAGHVLVDNRTALALQVHPLELPQGSEAGQKKARRAELQRLAKVTGMPYRRIRKEMHQSRKLLPSSPVTLRRDVSDDLVYYLRENQKKYPGISVDRVFVRDYPHGSEAAQVLGYVGQVSADELKQQRYQGVQPGDFVGKGGVEDEYDSSIRGINGTTRVQVDAAGQPTGGTLSQRAPRAGNDLQLTIDSKVQSAGESAIGQFGLPAAFVAMNIHNGQVLGLGSTPTFYPAALAKPRISQATFNSIFGDPDNPTATTGAPFFDRAIQGGYPVGSTMKPITTVAALESGTITPNTTINDTGTFDLGDGRTIQNAGGAAFGPVDLPTALTVSDDYYFYDVGYKLNQLTANDTRSGPLQKWAEALGLGSTTGIDLPGEAGGLVPSPEWRNALYKQAISPNSPGGRTALYPKETDRAWTVGDSVNLAVGQGDLLADPLQMAVAYSAIANGGEIVRPHVGMQVDDAKGQAVQEINPAPQRHVDVKSSYRQVILNALHNAAQTPSGTSYGVFGGYPVGVAGKTGTAQHNGQQDQSWYVVLAPFPNPKIAVAVTIEQGGFGADSAAPAARQILNAYFGEQMPNFAKKLANSAAVTPGTSSTTSNPYG